MNEFIIETENLTKRFYITKSLSQLFFNLLGKAKSVLAVNKISIKIKKGELFALLGPNGAGKTTLIKMLTCLVLPTEGIARVNGYDILKQEMPVKESIGLLTGNERSFYWRLTARENLNFFASLFGLSGKKAKARIEQLTKLLETQDLDRRFQEYSTGMKQRFAIIRCLLNDPAILFMDEPTKNLDPLAAEKLRDFIKNELVKQQGKTILFSTHNLTEAVRLGGRIAILDKGSIKACACLEELKNDAGLSPGAGIEEIFKYYVTVSTK